MELILQFDSFHFPTFYLHCFSIDGQNYSQSEVKRQEIYCLNINNGIIYKGPIS
jgi:hypothetical protein